MRKLILFVGLYLFATSPTVAGFSVSNDFSDSQSSQIERLKSRISDLNPPDKGLPENEFSLNDERRAVDSEISEVRSIAQRTVDRSKELEAIDKAKSIVSALLTELSKVECDLLKEGEFSVGDNIIKQLKALDRKLPSFSNGDESNPWDDPDAPYRLDSKGTDRDICLKWKKFAGDASKQLSLISYFDSLKLHYSEEVKKSSERKSQATALLDLLQKRKDAIEKKLVEQSTKSDLTDKLWIVIGIIGIFSISAIGAVKLFSDPIQIEWVASGQVIQFVTVMILLSVVMALGLAGILKENTLGTLLGGIAGYVLAQGVGRAAAREVTRERERGGG